MGKTWKDSYPNSLVPSEPACGPWSGSLPRESGSDPEDTLLPCNCLYLPISLRTLVMFPSSMARLRGVGPS